VFNDNTLSPGSKWHWACVLWWLIQLFTTNIWIIQGWYIKMCTTQKSYSIAYIWHLKLSYLLCALIQSDFQIHLTVLSECLNTNSDSWSTISETINTCSQCIYQVLPDWMHILCFTLRLSFYNLLFANL
jgi:hypothetical protein